SESAAYSVAAVVILTHFFLLLLSLIPRFLSQNRQTLFPMFQIMVIFPFFLMLRLMKVMSMLL
ncbi:hypothetical protein, partial [Clostridium perfringens]